MEMSIPRVADLSTNLTLFAHRRKSDDSRTMDRDDLDTFAAHRLTPHQHRKAIHHLAHLNQGASFASLVMIPRSMLGNASLDYPWADSVQSDVFLRHDLTVGPHESNNRTVPSGRCL
jgi:hypothetical protein